MLTFAEPLHRAERCHPDVEAVVNGSTRFSTGRFVERCRRLGGALGRYTERGDRVAVLGPASHHHLELYCAVPSIGRVVVPLNTRLATAELVDVVADAAPTVLFTDRSPGELGPLRSMVETVLPLDDAYEELLDAAPAARLGDRVSETDVAVLLYTGGTTGRSKGVMLTHRNKIADALSLQAGLGVTSDDRWLMMSPMFHAAGTFNVLVCLWAAAPMVLLDGFDPGRALDAIERERATITFVVPTMLGTLIDELERSPRDMSSLRILGYGAAPATSTLLRRVHSALPDVDLVTMYGATEMGPMGTLERHVERFVDDPRVRTAGRPVVGVDLRVVDAHDRELPAGAVGEVVVRGPAVMAGYRNRPEETAAALRSGWYHSGDLGHLDDHGLLYLVDRKKDMIVTGGENVYSTEVEDALGGHPDVVECAVFGVPHDHWGEAVHAVVVVREGRAVDAEELIDHCRARLAGYKLPRSMEVTTEPLPKSGAGKVLKRALREPHWRGAERRI